MKIMIEIAGRWSRLRTIEQTQSLWNEKNIELEKKEKLATKENSNDGREIDFLDQYFVLLHHVKFRWTF